MMILPVPSVEERGMEQTFWQTKVRSIKRLLRHLQKCSFIKLAL